MSTITTPRSAVGSGAPRRPRGRRWQNRWVGEGFFDRHRDRRTLFGQDAAAYDRGRPGYPERVFAVLRERCGLAPGCRVLEIGPGTGQATEGLLDLGASVTAVELSEALGARLAEKFAGRDLTVQIAAFEEANLAPQSFDLVVAATSFHWIAAQAGLNRCADVLRPGGSVALWWNHFGDPGRHDEFHDALVSRVRPIAPEVVDDSDTDGRGPAGHHALDAEARIRDFDETGRFGRVHHDVIAWTGRHTAIEIRALFGSYSPWLALPPERRSAALDELERLAVDEFNGIVERSYLTPLYFATRTS
jgi:SAM-dependent methyltransferase